MGSTSGEGSTSAIAVRTVHQCNCCETNPSDSEVNPSDSEVNPSDSETNPSYS